jgi:hypothetical protein
MESLHIQWLRDELPSLEKEGWTRQEEEFREATANGADGVVRSTTD